MINNYLMVISGVYYQIIFTLHLLEKKKKLLWKVMKKTNKTPLSKIMFRSCNCVHFKRSINFPENWILPLLKLLTFWS